MTEQAIEPRGVAKAHGPAPAALVLTGVDTPALTVLRSERTVP